MDNSQTKLILLDFDGTLADTRRANARAYVATLADAKLHKSIPHFPHPRYTRSSRRK